MRTTPRPTSDRRRGAQRRRFGVLLAAAALAAAGVGVAPTAAVAAPASEWESAPGYTVNVLEGEGATGRVAPLPADFVSSAAGDDFDVQYSGFTPEAEAAFQRAVDIWSTQLDVEVPITIDASFGELPPRALGGAGPTLIFTEGTQWFAVGLANQLVGQDLAPDSLDITATFSSTAPWHYDASTPAPPGTFDFTTVVLHEIGHGLGFLGATDYDPATGVGSWGVPLDGTTLPLRYTVFTETGDGTPLTSLPTPSTAVGDVLTGGDLFLDGPLTTASTPDGSRPELYAPAEYQPGSSFSHFDEGAYPGGTLNALMTPQVAPTERIARPGPMTLGVLADQGWTLQAGAYAANSLVLTSMCSPDPDEARVWRVRNQTGGDIPYTWDRYGTGLSGSGVATPGDSFFETPADSGANTLRLFAEGVLIHTKAATTAQCS